MYRDLVSMKTELLPYLCAFLLTACQTPTPATDSATFDYRLLVPEKLVPHVGIDVPSGLYGVAFHADLRSYRAVKVTLNLNKERFDKKWAPFCSLTLRDSPDYSDNGLRDVSSDHRLRIGLHPTDGPNLTMEEFDHHDLVDQFRLLDSANSVTVLVAWWNGYVLVEVNGIQVSKIVYPWKISSFTLGASTGSCEFSSITLFDKKQ